MRSKRDGEQLRRMRGRGDDAVVFGRVDGDGARAHALDERANARIGLRRDVRKLSREGKSLLRAAFLALVLLTPATEALALGCGLMPLPPLPPPGCRDMRPVCVCTVDRTCHWEFICDR